MPASGLPALDNTLGVLHLGVLVAMSLWGAGSVQMYYYYNWYTKDDWRVKLLVFAVWVLDTVHQGLIIHATYVYFITEYGNPVQLEKVVRTFYIMVMFSALNCFLVQCFLVRRVWCLSRKNIPVVAFLMLLVLTAFILQIVWFSEALPLTTFTTQYKIVNLTRAINAVIAISDIAIAVVLIVLLQRSRTGFSKSDSIINRLILFTVSTGALTSASATVSFITVMALPNTFVYVFFYINICKLYTNAFFATLNARESLHGWPQEGSSSHSIGRTRRHLAYENSASANSCTLDIKVDTETMHIGSMPTVTRAQQPYDTV